MEHKHKVTKSDHSFEASPSHTLDGKVSVKTEPQWMLEFESKIRDGASSDTRIYSRAIKREDTIDLKNIKCFDPVKWEDFVKCEDPVIPEDLVIDYQTKSEGVGTASQERNVNTTKHLFKKEATSALIEGMRCEETGVTSASKGSRHEYDVTLAGAMELKDDATSSHLPKRAGAGKECQRGFMQQVEEKPHQCNICGRVFSVAKELRKHLNALKGKKCQVCGLFFYTIAQRKKHHLVHTEGEKTYICTVCDLSFEYRHAFINHRGQSTHAYNQENVNMPANCDQGFGMAKRPRKHHSSLKVTKRQVCGHAFPSRAQKQTHHLEHTVEKMTYHCPICNRSFEYILTFINHTCLHNQEILHQPSLLVEKCKVCGLGFSTYAERKIHQREHTAGEKTHHCTLCNKWFEFFHDIENHTRQHQLHFTEWVPPFVS